MSGAARNKNMRHRATIGEVKRRTFMIRSLRFLLPGIMLGLVASYAVFATPQKINPDFESQFANLDLATQDLRMESPTFNGQNEDGIAFEITAGAAIQNPEDPDFITLDQPWAIKARDMADQMQVSATSGVYSTLDRTMDLTSNVEMLKGMIGEEFVLKTENAKVNFRDNIVESRVRVVGEGESGTITAEGMTAYEDEGRIVFHDAHMRIKKKPKPENADEDATN